MSLQSNLIVAKYLADVYEFNNGSTSADISLNDQLTFLHCELLA